MACIISQIMVCICERNESCSPGFYENYKALLTPLCYFRFSWFTVLWPISEAPPPRPCLLVPGVSIQAPSPQSAWTGLLPGAGPPFSGTLLVWLLTYFWILFLSSFQPWVGRHDRNTVSVPKLLRFWAQCFTSISQVVQAAVIQIEQMTDCTVSRNEQNWQAGSLPHPGNCSRDMWSCSFLSRGHSPQDQISHLAVRLEAWVPVLRPASSYVFLWRCRRSFPSWAVLLLFWFT